jgi:hypothetical protein
MEVLYRHCAGLDVHKDTVVACVRHILSDGDFALVLANAAHVKNVPGRKTDVTTPPGSPICWRTV